MKRTKTQRGITTIALAVTVMVLFTLAVVAIKAVQDDGIIKYAKLASQKYKYSDAREDAELIMSNWSVGKYLGETKTILEFLQENFSSVETLEDRKYKIFHKGYEFVITADESGNYTISNPEIPSDFWIYEIANDEVTITGFNLTGTGLGGVADSYYMYGTTMTLNFATLTFPSVLNGKPVTAIDLKQIISPGQFSSMWIPVYGVEKIVYSDSIKSISCSNYIFLWQDLKEVVLPKNLESITGNTLFGGRYYKDITLPETVKEVGHSSLIGVSVVWVKTNELYELGQKSWYGDFQGAWGANTLRKN